MQDERVLRIFCPTHKTSFLTAGESRIVCESGGEALAWNFPHEATWGYCCDCRSFWPSGIQKGKSIEGFCPVCARDGARRYLCGFCKLISFDSDEATKRKPFNVAQRGTVEPACPGCLKSAPSVLWQHHCDEAATEFATPLRSCPFCSESLADDLKVSERLSSSSDHLPKESGPLRAESDTQAEYRRAINAANAKAQNSTIFAADVAALSTTSTSTAETGESNRWIKPFLIVALVLSLGTIVVLSVFLMQSSTRVSQSNPANANSGSTTPANTASANPISRATPGASSSVQRPTPAAPIAPATGAKLAYCRSNQVFLRSEPYLDESEMNVIRVLSRNEKMWVLGTSTNYDTTYIRSAGGTVTNNWSEVQLYDDPAVRGWVFSYFVIY